MNIEHEMEKKPSSCVISCLSLLIKIAVHRQFFIGDWQSVTLQTE